MLSHRSHLFSRITGVAPLLRTKVIYLSIRPILKLSSRPLTINAVSIFEPIICSSIYPPTMIPFLIFLPPDIASLRAK